MTRGHGRPATARDTTKIVLVVNDDHEVRHLLTRFVAGLGLIAVPVADGAQAEVLWATLQPDLVLLDLKRGEADVPRLVVRFKAERPDTLIVVIARGGVAEVPGVDAVLWEPIRLSRLGQALGELLALPGQAPADAPRANGEGRSA
jgi:CheY-like chemotaxis protein